MANRTSQHILGASANLLGFCLVIITSLHITQKAESTLIDEFTSLIALGLTISNIFSFVSIRIENPTRADLFETFAEILFSLSMTGIAFIIIFIGITFWNGK